MKSYDISRKKPDRESFRSSEALTFYPPMKYMYVDMCKQGFWKERLETSVTNFPVDIEIVSFLVKLSKWDISENNKD